MAVEFIASPPASRADEPLDIRIRGLEPFEKVELIAEQDDVFGGLWKSGTEFAAGEAGEVDLSRAVPESGGYDWAEAMGPLLSMEAESEPGRSIGHLLQNTEPFELRLSLRRESGEVIEKRLKRFWTADGIRREEIRADGLFAVLYIPEGKGPFPALLVLNGSEGGMNENKAALLASCGYAAMALAYSNYESLPKTIKEVPIEYFEKAVDFLKSQAEVDEDRLGVTGFSYGGMLSLYLASRCPDFKAVVAYSPNCYVPGAVGADYNLPVASFTKDSEPVPFIRYPKNADSYFVEGGRLNAVELKDLFENAIDEASAEELEAAAIRVENIRGSVLMFSGGDDAMWPSRWFCEKVTGRMKSLDSEGECEYECYQDAGHFIGCPYTPFPPEVMIHPTDQKRYAFGGSNRGNSEAAESSWGKMLEFLKKALS